MARCPLLDHPAFSLSILDERRLRTESRIHMINWAVSKGFTLEHMGCGIVDTGSHAVYPIEMITSRHGKPCLMVILYTRKRVPRTYFREVIEYASAIHRTCTEHYAIAATTIIVNAFFKSSEEVGVTGISRVSWADDRSRRRNRESPPDASFPRVMRRHSTPPPQQSQH